MSERTEDIRVRAMAPGDLEAVWRLEQECFSEPWSMRTLAEVLAGGLDHLWVAETAGGPAARICGYADLRVFAGEGEIERIAVDPALRRQGTGRKLMEAMAAFAAEAGARDITLEVRAGNTAAQKLYESFGFAEEGRRKDYYRKPAEDALIMWKRSAKQVPAVRGPA